MSGPVDAARVIARALASAPKDGRDLYARELLANVAAALVLSKGEAAAAETVYRLADAIVARGRA